MTFYNEKGLKRFINSIFFSIAGLKAAWKHEEAFRQEVVVFILAIPISIWLGENNLEKALLIGSIVLILVAELLNSAIEAVVDKAGLEYHELAGRAKDMGSAAVMLLILMALSIWFMVLYK